MPQLILCAVSLVSKVVKYMNVMLELVRPCKYGAFYRIRAYCPDHMARPHGGGPHVSVGAFFTTNPLRFIFNMVPHFLEPAPSDLILMRSRISAQASG